MSWAGEVALGDAEAVAEAVVWLSRQTNLAEIRKGVRPERARRPTSKHGFQLEVTVTKLK